MSGSDNKGQCRQATPWLSNDWTRVEIKQSMENVKSPWLTVLQQQNKKKKIY